MTRQPLDCREWLEDMLRFNGRDAEWARELIDLLDVAEASENELVTISEKIGDFDEAASGLSLLARIENQAGDYDQLLGGMDGEDLAGQLATLLASYRDLEQQTWDLQALCAEAGLIEPNDYATDPLPLLRMFLPLQ